MGLAGDIIATLTQYSSNQGVAVVTRQTGPGSYSGGLYVPATTETVSINMSIQPFKGAEILALPEGERVKSYYKTYSEAPLFAANPTTKQQADTINFQGNQYVVMAEGQWDYVMGYGKYTIVRVNPG